MRKGRGFTLVEVLVVIAIIGILSSVIYANFGSANAAGRDAKRQTDLRNLKTAIELYKQRNGRYPAMGCSAGSDGLSGENDCDNYISGLAPEFIARLPHDPKRGSNTGYAYITNTNGTVFKVMAVNTVESETVDYTHEYRSCDIRPDSLGRIKNIGANSTQAQINDAGWCVRAVSSGGVPQTTGGTANIQPIPACRMSSGAFLDGGNGRFERTYGLWGGFEEYNNTTSYYWYGLRFTTTIICR